MGALFDIQLPRREGGYNLRAFPTLHRVVPRRADRSVELLEQLVAAAERLERALEKPKVEARLLDRDEASAFLGVSTRSFERHVAPDLGRVTVGTRVLFRRDELEKWIDDKTRWPSRAR